MYFKFITFSFGLVILTLLIFGILQWSHVPAGNFLDWIVGMATFWWLLVIVTVPWNVHFDAKEVLAEAAQSAEKGIAVDAKQLNYARSIAQRSFWVAIALHIFSAASLYALAATGISAVGYIGAGAALLLTILRPSVRAYEYLARRLRAIQQEFQYPRADVMELRDRFNSLEITVKQLEQKFNLENPNSWATLQQQQREAIRQDLTRLNVGLEELRVINQSEHERLSRESKQAIAQLTADGQFLEHVREIIRFFKSA